MKKINFLTILMLLSCIAMTTFVMAAESEPPHNCRIYASTSNSYPTSILTKDLVLGAESLKQLSATTYIDGWGVASYDNGQLSMGRSQYSAYEDPSFNFYIAELDTSKPQIVLGHIRQCTSGCCAPGQRLIPDPHPFFMYNKLGKDWTFAHNGNVDKNKMNELINDNYLLANPYTGSYVANCNVNTFSQVIDSEMYFTYIMQMVEQEQDAKKGIIIALKNMINSGEPGQLNFVLSDGDKVYAFRRGLTLHYKHTSNYDAVASQPPNQNDGWVALNDYNLIILDAGKLPDIVSDVRTYNTSSPPIKPNVEFPFTFPELPLTTILMLVVGIILFLYSAYRLGRGTR